jgi:hypothetical protein
MNHMALYPRRFYSLQPLLCEPQILHTYIFYMKCYSSVNNYEHGGGDDDDDDDDDESL